MNRFAIHVLSLLIWLPLQGATNPPSARALLLDDKAAIELTARLTQYENLPKLTGRLTCIGSGMVTILVNRWASEFATLYPEVEFDIRGGGSEGGFPAFLEGKVDLLPMSRPLSADETARFKARHGYEPAQIIVAQDAVGIYVNKNNPLTGLTLVQLDGLYSRDARRGGQRAEFWRDLGVTGPLAEARISRFCLVRFQDTHQYSSGRGHARIRLPV